jgi:predicted transcriptional regulator of viral defense system
MSVVTGILTTMGATVPRRPAGILTTAELVAAGKSAGQIRRLVSKGALIPVGRGVYARAALARSYCTRSERDRAMRVAGAQVLAGSGAVASHQSAAELHGLVLLGKPGNTVTLTAVADRGRRGRAGIHVYTTELPDGQVTIRHGLKVTTVARTVIDLARTSSFRAGVVSADSALGARQTTKEELRAVLAGCRRWPGAGRAAEVVEFADKLAESALESIARVVFRDCGLPPPQLQAWVGGDRVIGRADFFWKQFNTIAEVDGAMKYADPDRARQQLRRDADLRDAGFEVVHFTWQEITQAPEYVAASIRAAFARGAYGPAGS